MLVLALVPALVPVLLVLLLLLLLQPLLLLQLLLSYFYLLPYFYLLCTYFYLLLTFTLLLPTLLDYFSYFTTLQPLLLQPARESVLNALDKDQNMVRRIARPPVLFKALAPQAVGGALCPQRKKVKECAGFQPPKMTC